MANYYRVFFCILLALAILSTAIISAPVVTNAAQYNTLTFSPTKVGGTISGGGAVISQGFTVQNIATQNCAAGTCDAVNNSLNYGFDGTSSAKSTIKIVLTYDLSSLGIGGSQVKDMTINLGGCWHGGSGVSCNNSDNPEFNSNGGRLYFSMWNGVNWEALGDVINLGSDTNSTADNYATYQATKSSGFTDSYLDSKGFVRIGVQTGGTTTGENDVQEVIDFASLNVTYLPTRTDTRPNIIVIMTDDQRWDTIKYMPTVQNKIFGEGMEFTNSFVSDPLCCPSRSSFLTGQYAHDHGVWTNQAPDGGASVLKDTSTLPVWLQNAGYETALIGKYLNDYKDMMPYVPPGWNDWHVHAPPLPYKYTMNDNGVLTKYNSTEADYSTDVLRDKALDFIKQADRPFFMWFTPDAPHVTPTGYAVPAKRHASQCENIQNRPPSFYESDVSDKPQWVENLKPENSSLVAVTDKISKSQVCSLKAVDEAVDSIINQLGPELDNTVIIFTSDNGYEWGEHRWNFKSCEYEECIRVPLAIRYPKLIAPGQHSDEMVMNLDLTATIIDLTQATPGLKQRGESLVPLFANSSSTTWRQDFLIEQARYPDAATLLVPAFTGFRTTTDKYVELETGENEYYDLVNDPFELNNLSKDPAYADTILQKQQRLAEIVNETYS